MWNATGQQYELADASGRARAVITQVAAGIRELTVAGTALTETFPAGQVPPKACGTMLVPWPNRVRDGRWQHDGVVEQLPLTEPARGNAIHGLLRDRPYRCVEQTSSSVTLAAAIYPQHGYPFTLDTEVRHELDADGLTTTHTITNRGTDAAPVAVGAHPYLRVGDTDVDDLTLHLAAATHFEVDEQAIPVAEHDVEGTAFDLRRGVRVGELNLDDGFGGIRPHHGVVEHRLLADDGRGVVLWGDEWMRYAQVFTPRPFADDARRTAIAVEPMSAPADALNSGAGLVRLEPGERWQVRWGIRAVGV